MAPKRPREVHHRPLWCFSWYLTCWQGPSRTMSSQGIFLFVVGLDPVSRAGIRSGGAYPRVCQEDWFKSLESLHSHFVLKDARARYVRTWGECQHCVYTMTEELPYALWQRDCRIWHICALSLSCHSKQKRTKCGKYLSSLGTFSHRDDHLHRHAV